MIYPALSPIGQVLRRRQGQWIGGYRSASGQTPEAVLDFSGGTYGVAGMRSATPLVTGRFGPVAVDGIGPGLLVEPERTNLVAKSVARATGWSGVGPVVMTALNENAFGLFPGLRIQTGGATWHRATPGSMTFVAGTAYAAQLWYRATSTNQVKLTLFSSATTPSTNLELKGASGAIAAVLQNNGAVTSVINTDFGGGLYRLSFVFSVAATISTGWGLGTGTTVSGDDIVVYAFQVENGADPSSYILADGAQATRAANPVTLIPTGWGEGPERSVAFEVTPLSGQIEIASLEDTAGRTLKCVRQANGAISVELGNPQSVIQTGVVAALNTPVKVAIAWDAGAVAVSVNGGAVTSAVAPGLGNLAQVRFGAGAAGASSGPALHHNFRSFSSRISNPDLAEL